MTLKETVLYEIETVNEELLQEVIELIRSRKHTIPIVGETSRNGDRSPNHPLRGIPLVLPHPW